VPDVSGNATVAITLGARKVDLALEGCECQIYNVLVRREFSAGGVVVRRLDRAWRLAAIRPAGKEGVWALPKGIVRRDEPPAEAASREITEETGVRARLVEKLGDVRYVYSWQGERVFKIVSFFLFRYEGGRLGELAPEHEHEVAEARWLPLDESPQLLSYTGEREMARKAMERLRTP
jgi:ADP-ribose pyrophosphatase YjhB (NUDIX family)